MDNNTVTICHFIFAHSSQTITELISPPKKTQRNGTKKNNLTFTGKFINKESPIINRNKNFRSFKQYATRIGYQFVLRTEKKATKKQFFKMFSNRIRLLFIV